MISIREYARRKEYSESYIRKLITKGIITSQAVLANHRGQPAIDEYLANCDLAAYYGTPMPEPPVVELPKAPVLRAAPAPRELIDPVENPRDVVPSKPSTGKTKAELDKIHAELKIQLTAMELKERKGVLVDKAAVYKALFEIGQELRRDVMSIPDKWVDNIRAAKTRQEAHSMLYNALAESLKSISEVDEIKFKAR
jgi:hypothetical protein